MGGKKRSAPGRPPSGTPAKKPKLPGRGTENKTKSGRKFDAIPVDEKVESFPRGGKQLLTPLEKSIIKAQAKQDLLFDESREDGDGMEGAESEEVERARQDDIMLGPEKAKKAPPGKTKVKRIEILNVKGVVPGMLLLGAVLEVQEYVVVFSLPFNMRGTVTISDVSGHVTKLVESEVQHMDSSQEDEDGEVAGRTEIPLMERLFSVGQLMPCYVQAVEKGRVSLSVNPELINSHLSAKDLKPKLLLPGSVKSVEDHGYIIDFGVEGKTGFLLKKNAAEFVRSRCKGRSLCVGQVVHCAVLAGPDTRTVPISVNPSDVGVAMMSSSEHLIGMGSLLPGLLVKAAIKEVASNGLIMTFLDGFTGTVAPQHLPSAQFLDPDKLRAKKKLKARLLWVDVAVKKVGLTLQQELVEGRAHEFPEMEIGSCYEAAKVMLIDHLSGIYLELEGSGGKTGYAPPWMVTDEERQADSAPIKQQKRYRKGSVHQARVCQFNRIDGLAILSLQKSVLEKPYMKYSDIEVGDIVGGVIERVCSFGMIVSVTDSLRGICPRIHTSDTKTIVSRPSIKYKEGSKVKCRVVNVDPAHKRLMLTCKKSLLRSGTVLADYASVQPGDRCNGVVTSVHTYGCIVHFFNRVKGLVRKADLGPAAARNMSDLTQVFWAGQPVECRVLECDVPTERLLLSFVLDPDKEVAIDDADALAPGSIVEGELTAIASNGISLKYPVTGEPLFLPTLHLSDYPHHCSLLLSSHQRQLEGALKQKRLYILRGLLVVSGRLQFKPAQVTMKSSMLTHMEKKGYISAITDFKVGVVQPGFIRNLQPYGCFVEFPHQLTGLAPIKYLSDQFVSQPSEVYQETQTVWAKVQGLDDNEGRLSLTLRPSDLKVADLQSEGAVAGILSTFQSYVSERCSILEEMKLTQDTTAAAHSLPALARAFVPSGRVTGHVISLANDSAMVGLEGGLRGKIVKASMHGGNLGEGAEVVCSILDVDLIECCLVLSRNQSVLQNQPVGSEGSTAATATPAQGKKKKGKSRSAAALEEAWLSPGTSMVGLVEHKTPYYLVLSCSTLTGCRMAYGLINSGQLGVLPSSFYRLRIGQQVRGSVVSGSCEYGGLPVVMVTDVVSKSNLPALASSSTSSNLVAAIPDIQVGDIISVVVQNIKPDQMNVKHQLWRGRVHSTMAKDPNGDITMTSLPKSVFSDWNVGDSVKAKVICINERHVQKQGSKDGAVVKVLELTTRPSLLDPAVTIDTDSLLKKVFSTGEEVNAVVWQVSCRGLHVHITPRARGFIPLMCVSKDIKVLRNLKKHCHEGQVVRCVVTGEGTGLAAYDLSMIGPLCAPKEGDVLAARTREVLPGRGLVVSTPIGMGRVDITDISDCYRADPFAVVREGQLIKCCVVGVEGKKLDFSLRPSRMQQCRGDEEVGDPELCDFEGLEAKREARDPEIHDLGDLEDGKLVRGYVKSVTDLGVYVRLGRNLDGRVQITHLADGFVKEYKSLYSVGDLVTAKIIKVDRVGKKVDLSLRLSQVDPEAAKRKRKRLGERKKRQKLSSGGESNQEHGSGSDEDMKGGVCEAVEASSDEDSAGDDDDDSAESADEMKVSGAGAKPTLQLEGGFKWDMGPPGEPAGGMAEPRPSSDSGEEEMENLEAAISKRSRRQKKAVKKAEELELYKKEHSLLEAGKGPESADDFDRLLLTTPNNSSLWIQYMAFHLHTVEVGGARAVAQRALRTISFREIAEKLNVWVGWMNLENRFGSQETLAKVFESALQQNEPLDVYKKLASIYVQSEKYDFANKLYQTMTKKFANVLSVWSQYTTFLMKQGRQAQARVLLQKGLKGLASKRDHVSLISKFSQLEFKHGEPERGRTMFERLLSTYPKRVDLWSVYIDTVLSTGDTQKVRDIFERAIHLKIPSKKMKLVFKRYLEFERQYGNQVLVEQVIEKTRSYVEQLKLLK